MKVNPGNAQHIGDRDSQQDAFGFSSFGDAAFEAHGGVMMVLCDGMGGLANGADASTTAVNAVLAGYQQKLPIESIPDALNRVIHEAHRAVCDVSGEGRAAGTTVVAAVVWQDRLYWASLGDSRLYLCRGDAPAEQLTVDHNLGTLMDARARRGESSRRDVVAVKDREALTAYLGAPNPPPPYAGRDGRALEPGDRIVACSDGLYRGLPPSEIAEISRVADPMTAAEQMVQAVLRQRLPYQDNLTVALLEVAAPRRRLVVPDSPLLAKALPVTAGFVAGVVVTCLLLVVLPGIFSPVTVPPSASVPAVEQPLPQAITPQAITPQAITPQAITPQAVTPQAVTPQAVTPQAVTPQASPAVTPQATHPELQQPAPPDANAGTAPVVDAGEGSKPSAEPPPPKAQPSPDQGENRPKPPGNTSSQGKTGANKDAKDIPSPQSASSKPDSPGAQVPAIPLPPPRPPPVPPTHAGAASSGGAGH